ncbi:hypothetical protein ACSCBZ_46385 [Streptomyces niveiscabiei]|uniref:hypothetical protein n=1 Tax=Streptomyces niveiscabiei TaxID=164115 RepID=UPI000B1A278C|nr:hypothetical protein [Streptomyces niveiscabiei]
MATTEAVLAALAELREDLDAGAWTPDEYERLLAVTARMAGPATAHTVRIGLRAVGPDGTEGRLIVIAARCGYVLDGMSLTGAQEQSAVRDALDELLDLVTIAGLHQSRDRH